MPQATPRARATQTIPPAIRRQVLRRDGKRCVVDGCDNHRYLDVHHIDPRAEGGNDDPERLASLCGAHHRAVHQSHLRVDGTGKKGFICRHADGSPYGTSLSPQAIELVQKVQSALLHLGFKPNKVAAIIQVVQRAGAPQDLESFIRAALRASSEQPA